LYFWWSRWFFAYSKNALERILLYSNAQKFLDRKMSGRLENAILSRNLKFSPLWIELWVFLIRNRAKTLGSIRSKTCYFPKFIGISKSSKFFQIPTKVTHRLENAILSHNLKFSPLWIELWVFLIRNRAKALGSIRSKTCYFPEFIGISESSKFFQIPTKVTHRLENAILSRNLKKIQTFKISLSCNFSTFASRTRFLFLVIRLFCEL
jgi:hypothetical protein